MKVVGQPKLRDHSLVPQFDLSATGDRRVMLWSYKGLKNLILLFLPDIGTAEAQDYLCGLAQRYQQVIEHNTEILVISQENIEALERLAEDLELPFPLLSDVDGSVTDSYAFITPSIFVVDRYGELYTQSEAEMEQNFPDYQRILDWLHLIELQCPECGVPTWVEG